MPCFPRRGAVAAALSLCLALAACGGGTSNQYAGSTLAGQVLMEASAPVAGSANICLFAVADGLGNPLDTAVVPPVGTGTLLTSGCISSNSQGQFVQALPNFYGPVLVQVANGYYYNRASSSSVALSNLTQTNDSLQALAFVGGGGTVNVVVSPLTTIATAMANRMPGGLNAANYAAAIAKVEAEFQLGGLNITQAPSSGDAQDLVLRGIERYLVDPPGSTDDPTGANLLNWNVAALTTMSADYSNAYDAINTSATHFTFY